MLDSRCFFCKIACSEVFFQSGRHLSAAGKVTMPEAVSELVKINNSSLRLIRGDITELEIDAFVYYAQHDLVLGSGFGGAIAVRGGPSIQKELNELGPLKTTETVVSEAGNLNATCIVHAVGPRFNEQDTESKLRATISNALEAAQQKGAKRVALPAMGTGFYGISLELCARVMVETVKSHLEGKTPIEEVVICVNDKRELPPFESQLASL
jgi:O-acetyl-ADP-ribose deacetylase (regulator of RNase III)